MKKLLFFIALLFTAGAIAAQPTVTGNTRLTLTEGNNTWKATLNSLLSGRVGPDSTFSTTAGSYLNKRRTDHRYTGGTTLFQGKGGSSTDTAGVVIISQDQNSSKPSIWLDGNQQYLMEVEGDSRGDSLSDFGMYRIWTDNNSSQGDNQVWIAGFNTTPGGGKKVSSRSSASYRIEEKYVLNNHPAYEFHLPDIQFKNSSSGRRPFSGVFGHEARFGGYWGFNTDYILFNDYTNNTGKAIWAFHGTAYSKGISLLDTASIYFYKNNLSSIFFRNAANSAFLTGLTADASDRIAIGGSNVANILFANDIDMRQTDGVIYNSNNATITVGNSANKTLLSVWSPATETLRLRSSTGGSNLWRTYINSDNIVYALPSGSNYLQFYTNSTYILGANDRIGIGTSPGSRFHIRQNGNSAGNGIQMTNSDASFSAYRALDASGDETWYNNGGTAKIKIKQAGDFELRAASPLKFYDSDNSNTVTISPPSAGSLTANYTLTLPTDDGTTNQVLTTDGSGGLSWTSPSGSGTVTSVGLTMPTGFSVSGSPVTGAGTLAVTTTLNGVVKGNGSAFTASAVDLSTEVTGTLPVSSGGTGQTTWTSGVIPYGNSGSALQSTTNMQYGSGVFQLKNSTVSTTAFNAASSENYRVQNTDNTASNWSGISSYSQGGSIASGIGFQHLNHTSHYDDIAFYTRGSSTGWGEALRITSEKKIQVPTLGTTVTAIVGRNASNELASASLSSELAISSGTIKLAQQSATSGQVLEWNGSAWAPATDDSGSGVTDHGALTGLADDDHTQYALLAGRATGQVLTGGTASGDDLTLRSTTNATKGDLVMLDQGGNAILGGAETASELRFLEPSGSGTNYTALKAQAQAASVTYTLPAAAPTTSGQVLAGTTSGTLSWVDKADAPAIISPSNITVDQNDYTPTGWSTSTVAFVTGDATIRAITGFGALATGTVRTLVNTGTAPLYIPGEHPSSTAANRVTTAVDQILAPNGGSITLVYNGTTSRWFVVNNTFNPAVMAANGVNGHYYNVTVGATTGADWGTVGFATASGSNGTSLATSTLPAGWDINTASSATGASSLYLSKTVVNPTEFGSSHMVASVSVNFPTLSDGSQTYTFQFGMVATSSSTTLAVNNSVAIRYSSGINSGKFEGFSRNNSGTESTVDLGVTVAATTNYLLTVCYDKARSEARFYINGAYAGRVTGSMPNSNIDCGARAIIVKSAGTTSRSAVIPTFTFFTVYGS